MRIDVSENVLFEGHLERVTKNALDYTRKMCIECIAPIHLLPLFPSLLSVAYRSSPSGQTDKAVGLKSHVNFIFIIRFLELLRSPEWIKICIGCHYYYYYYYCSQPSCEQNHPYYLD